MEDGWKEDGRWKMENGKRKTENGKRKTESGKRKTENGKRKTENDLCYIQATLNSGFPNLNIKSPNFTFCKARIKELAVQVIKSSSHQH